MTKKLHLIMPMGGGGVRFHDGGFVMPKPLIEIHGKPFFYWAVQSVLKDAAKIGCENLIDITCVVLQKHVDENKIDEEILKFFPDAKIKVIPEILPGAVCTCLKGVEDIDDENFVLFNDCDQMFSCPSMPEKIFGGEINFSGALMTFESSSPNYSYVRYDDAGNVTGTVEKKVVSNRAICGAYFFANAEIFRQASEKYFETCQYKEFFVSGVYDELCKAGRKVETFLTDWHLPFGTPAEYETAKNSPHFEEILK